MCSYCVECGLHRWQSSRLRRRRPKTKTHQVGAHACRVRRDSRLGGALYHSESWQWRSRVFLGTATCPDHWRGMKRGNLVNGLRASRDESRRTHAASDVLTPSAVDCCFSHVHSVVKPSCVDQVLALSAGACGPFELMAPPTYAACGWRCAQVSLVSCVRVCSHCDVLARNAVHFQSVPVLVPEMVSFSALA